MAYHLSFCCNKTGKTFEEVWKFNGIDGVLIVLTTLFSEASTEPASILMEAQHDGKCIRKVDYLNKKHNGKVIFKIKVEKKDED